MQVNVDHEQLIDYIEGELPAEAMAQVDAVLAADPKLRRLVEGMRADRALLRSMPQEMVARPVVEDLVASLERQLLLGEAPTDAADDPIEAARRRRMRLGPRLIRVGSYLAIAAAVAGAASVLLVMLSDGSLLHDAQPGRWRTGAGGGLVTATDPAGPAEKRSAPGDLDGVVVAGRAVGGEPEVGADAVSEVSEAGRASAALEDAGPDGAVGHEAVSGDRPVANEGRPVAMLKQVADAGAGSFDADGGGWAEANLVIADAAMEVVSDDPVQTAALLDQWIAMNDAAVMPAGRVGAVGRAGVDGLAAEPAVEGLDDAVAGARSRRADADGGEVAVEGDATYQVVLDASQVPDLMAYMNAARGNRQVARLAAPVPVTTRALERGIAVPAAPSAPSAPGAPRAQGVEGVVADVVAEEAEAVAMPLRSEAVAVASGVPEETQAAVEPGSRDQRQVQAAPGAAPSGGAGGVATVSGEVAEAKVGGQSPEVALRSSSVAAVGGEGGDLDGGERKAVVQREDSVKVDGVKKDGVKEERAGAVEVAERMGADGLKVAAPNDEAGSNREPLAVAEGDDAVVDVAADVAAGDAVAGVAEDAEGAPVPARGDGFDWGAVLYSQLPLSEDTPLRLARRQRVVLPLVIRRQVEGAVPKGIEPAASNRPAEVEVERGSGDRSNDQPSSSPPPR